MTRTRSRAKRVNDVPGFKWCRKCERRLKVERFGLARDRSDGLNAYCRECRGADQKARRAANPEWHRADTRARYAANPAQWHAKVAVARAIARGILQKPAAGTPCPDCNRVLPLEAHHHNGYEKEHWLDVRWCCRACHRSTHVEQSIDVDNMPLFPPGNPHPVYPTMRPVAPRWAREKDLGGATVTRSP